MDTPISYTIEQAIKLTGIGRTKFYEELKSGKIPARKLGRRTLIPHDGLYAYIDKLDVYPTKKAKS